MFDEAEAFAALGAATGFELHAKTTRRAAFLAEMEQVVPWRRLIALIEPYYPKAGNGRPPVGLERMLRIYFLQQWFNLSDPAAEEALYDSATMRAFAGIDLGREPAPDETTICRFRHLLEAHDLGARMFEEHGSSIADRPQWAIDALTAKSYGRRGRSRPSVQAPAAPPGQIRRRPPFGSSRLCRPAQRASSPTRRS